MRLRAEVEPLGIAVTCVEPGPFRTDWAGRSLRQTPVRDRATTPRAPASAWRRPRPIAEPSPATRARGRSDHRPDRGRPPAAPSRAGAFGYNAVTEKLRARLAEIEAHKERSLGADFPKT